MRKIRIRLYWWLVRLADWVRPDYKHETDEDILTKPQDEVVEETLGHMDMSEHRCNDDFVDKAKEIIHKEPYEPYAESEVAERKITDVETKYVTMKVDEFIGLTGDIEIKKDAGRDIRISQLFNKHVQPKSKYIERPNEC